MRRFTLLEANNVATRIAPLIGDMLRRRGKLIARRPELAPVLRDLTSNVGGIAASAATLDLLALEQLMANIRGYGCRLTHGHFGHVDFLTDIDGREMYYCWRLGESEVAHYHELNEGYEQRRALP